PAAPADQAWVVQEKGLATGTLHDLATFPGIKVVGADGTGTMTAVTAVSSGSTAPIVFTYTALAGGMSNGEIELTVPAGWTAPTTTNSSASTGTLAISSTDPRTIDVTRVTLNTPFTMTITYRTAGSATAPAPATP